MRRIVDDAAHWWDGQSLTTRWSAAGVLLGVLVGVVLAVVLAGSGGGGPAVVVSPVTPSPTPIVATAAPTPTPTATAPAAGTATSTPPATPEASPSPTPTATPTPTEAATPTATGTATATGTTAPAPGPPTYFSLDALRGAVGEAPDATLGRMRIPVIGVDAALGQRFVSDGVMPNPTGPSDVVWYDLSLWERLGGSPGGGNNAVFSGHVDFRAAVPWTDVRYHGEGIFSDLKLLATGDVIEVDVGGLTLRYAVAWVSQVSGEDGDWASILSADVERDSITLITCGGEFSTTTRTYSDRLVVRAERIGT